MGGTPANGQTYTARVGNATNGRTVTYTATGADTNATIAAGLQALLALSAFPEFQEVTWTVASAVVTGTGPSTGVPFTLSASASGTGTLTAATATAASSPYHWSVAANWKENSVPATGDDVVIDEGPAIRYGLDQSAVTLASLRITPNWPDGGEVGLPASTSPGDPAGGYPEYRDQRLKVSATVVEVETGSRRVRLDLGSNASTVTVNGTGSPAAGETAVDLIGVHADNVLRVNKGSVGVAAVAGDVSTFDSVAVAYRDQQAGDAAVRLGRGLTLDTLTQSGGTVALDCGATTVERSGGTLTRTGSGTLGTVRNRGGLLRDEGTGTITLLENSATYERRGLAPLTVTDCTLFAGSVTDDQQGTITWTNAVEFFECHPAGPASNPGPRPAYFLFGTHKKVTPEAI